MDAAKLLRYRDLVGVLLEKELKVRYKSTVLGYVWSVLHPLAFAAVFYLVFRVIVRVDVPNYGLFLILGLFPWQWLQNSVSESAGVYLANAGLIKRVRFPRWTLVLAIALNDMTHFALALPVIGLFLALGSISPSWTWLWGVPLLAACQLLLTLGIALAVASSNLFLRDLERLVQIGLLLWFYLTPVLYPPEMAPEGVRWLFHLNPAADLVVCWRSLFLHGALPGAPFAVACAHAIAVCAAGAAVYRSTEWRFSEVV